MKKLTITLITLAFTLNYVACSTQPVSTNAAKRPSNLAPNGEICDNGVDDNNDGLADCHDSGCNTYCTWLLSEKTKTTKPTTPKAISKKSSKPKSKAQKAKEQAQLDADCAEQKKLEGFAMCDEYRRCSRSRFCQPEGDCKDGKDNDDDGRVDCADGDCAYEAHCIAKNFVVEQPKPIKVLEKPMSVASIKAEAQQMLKEHQAWLKKRCEESLKECKEGKGLYEPTPCFMPPCSNRNVIRKCDACTEEGHLADSGYLKPGKLKGHDLISLRNDLRSALVFQFYYDMIGQKLCPIMNEMASIKKMYHLTQNAIANAKKYYEGLKQVNDKVKLLKQRPIPVLPIPPVGVCKQLDNGKFVWRYNTIPSYRLR